MRIDPPAKLDAVDDIAPLVRAAELEPAVGAARQLQEVVALEDHVVELEEGKRLLAVHAELDAVEAQHPVDREMLADLAQEGDIFEPVEPLGIVEQDRVRRPVTEGQEAFEDPLDRGDVGVDRLGGEQLAGLVLEAWIADLRGSAAHQHDRLVPGLLEPAEHHDLDEAADVERRRGGVEAYVAGDDLRLSERVEALGVGELVDEAALVERAEEGGFVVGHGRGG